MQHLSRIKGFWPYLLVVFLNAFVDLGHKIVLQNTIFKVWDGQTQVILTAIVNALILLPFILLFSPAGFLSDRFPKHRVIRYGALVAVSGTILISISYLCGWFWVAFGLTLLLSIQSAIYSPAKYGYIREMVGNERLAQANGVVQALTIVSILVATFVFSILFESRYRLVESYAGFVGGGASITQLLPDQILQAMVPLGGLLILLSLIEWLAAHRIPQQYAGAPDKRFDMSGYLRGNYLKNNLGIIRSKRAIWLPIVGLSIFWAVSQVVLAAFPSHAKAILEETNTVVIQGLLAASGIGIIFGSVVAGRISRSYLELGLIPVSAFGISLCLLLLPSLQSAPGIALLFILLGTCGGLFIVPLNALIQYSSDERELGTVLAGNNWVQNITMLSFLGLTIVFSLSGFSSKALIYLLAITSFCGAIYTVRQLPHSLARILASAILQRRYRITVEGFENLPRDGGVLLLGNHISWIDWAMVQIACPRPVRFVMLRRIYDTWYLRPILKFFGAIPISAGQSREALAAVNECLKNGEVVCLFPEGAISRTGHLGSFKSGYEKAVQGVDAVIVPFYLRGLWGSRLSYSRSRKLRETTSEGFKRHVVVAFGESLPISTRAQTLKQKVFELSVTAWETYTETLDNIPLTWLKQAKSNLNAAGLVESGGQPLSNAKVITATTLLANHMHRHANHMHRHANHMHRHASHMNNRDGKSCIGLLLPTSAGGIMANMAVMLNGQTAVNLNYTSGREALRSAVNKAGIQTVYTSTRFEKKLVTRGIHLAEWLPEIEFIHLEDLFQNLSPLRKLSHAVATRVLPATLLYRLFGHPAHLEHTAQILFSSGSEGDPKGIMLSHRNLMGNIKQISDALNTREDDVMMASLPLFHSFGLTVNSLLPLIEGVPAVCHPDPTDVLGIARAISRHRATILCGTATFLRLYTRNRRVHPLMLDSLRVVVAGAEKLTDDVRQAFEGKFRKTIYEGYGTTETTPVASVNIPDTLDTGSWSVQHGHKPGSVGLPLPGSCFRIVDPDSCRQLDPGEDGLILISGGQVMQGYLNDEALTREAIVEIDGRRWYKTGDKGHLDEDGFLTIVDRYSRFAKIGGEMISLGAVEQAVRGILKDPDLEFAATAVSDPKKGEKIVLVTSADTDAGLLKQQLLEASVNPLLIPSEVRRVVELPKLGSGKLDYKGLRQVASC